jgi:DNA-binding MarR family transcriptional regulator
MSEDGHMAVTQTGCPTGDERVQLFALLLDTNARLARSFSSVLERACEIPLPWFEVLMQLRQAEGGRLKMNEVAEAIVLSTGGTTRLVDRLEEAGLVARVNCPEDRRAIYVALTEAGETKLNEALRVHLAYLDDHVSRRLTGDERRALTALLEKLQAPA